jgi:hypothetical protein
MVVLVRDSAAQKVPPSLEHLITLAYGLLDKKEEGTLSALDFHHVHK